MDDYGSVPIIPCVKRTSHGYPIAAFGDTDGDQSQPGRRCCAIDPVGLASSLNMWGNQACSEQLGSCIGVGILKKKQHMFTITKVGDCW